MKEKFVFFIAKLLGVDIKLKGKLRGVKFANGEEYLYRGSERKDESNHVYKGSKGCS